ncbi:3591_t:CDS:2 [Diversispora eburnea]|uniref:3591_t:CDS:1 n=1 Tax=Diversispora eburnea TaxID=1213867 RepID=A0A9N9F0W3_9GLOM|nr:3591_t:CDS:2 [Diversispora eburnea]
MNSRYDIYICVKRSNLFCYISSPATTNNIDTATSTPKLPDPKIIEQVISEIDLRTRSEIDRQITVPIENLIRPTTKSRKGGIPRPQNPFVIYRRDLQAKLTARLGPDVGSHLPFVSKEASRKWEIEREDIKNIYEVMAELAKKVHERTYPDYVYKPRKHRFLIMKYI